MRLPERYANMLLKFQAVTTPDFSIYADMPEAMQIYSHYKKQWLGAYWQELGMQVIATATWGDEKTFSWCFDDMPQNSCIAVSSVGCMNDLRSREMFIAGYNEMKKRLKPSKVYFWEHKPKEIDGYIVLMGSFQEQVRERVKSDGRKRSI